MMSPTSANIVIPYNMLSNEYQRKILEDEYTNADDPYELLELYTKPIFTIYSDRTVDISLSTEGYKKEPEGYFLVGEQWYYIKHEIDVKPSFLTLDIKVVRWYIEITKVESPIGIQSP